MSAKDVTLPETMPEFSLFQPGGPGWEEVSKDVLLDHRHVHVEQVRYRTPNRQGEPVPWTVVRRKAAVAVAPVTADGKFLLIHQERLPVQELCWEFPAGQIDLPLAEITQEAVVMAALRELAEESGYALAPGGVLEPLGWFFPSQGFTDEHVYLFKAEPVCVASGPEPDGSEHISDVRLVSPGELRRMIAASEITNALTLAMFARMAAKGAI